MKNKALYIKIGINFGVLVLVFFAFNYFLLVPYNLRLGSIWFYVAILILLPGSIMLMINIEAAKSYDREPKKLSKHSTISILVGAGLILFYLIVSFFSTSVFNAERYYNLIGDVPEAIEFTNDFDAVDTESNLPVVDASLAAQLGDKEFGQFGSLGSEFHVGEFHDLSVDGDLVAVAPLEFNGFFKWLNNRQGSPGYVVVNKTTGDVEVITGLEMEYMPTAYFGQDLHRYLYKHGDNAKKYELIDFALELDDDLNPYWVVSALHPTIGFSGGKQVAGIYIVNPVNGEINFYTPENAPLWVDTVFPKEFVINQLNYWGGLADGWFNSILAQKNVIQTTSGTRRVYNDDRVYHYTGLTSASSDEATVGFIFVNTRTKEVVRYNMSGATETAAMDSAEGIVQNYGYYATFPIPMNVYNEPTFFITLKDNKGLIKQYAFVNVSDFAIVGIGDSIDSAYADYGEKLDDEHTIFYDEEDLTTIRGDVQRISMSVVDGTSQYEILIDDVLYIARYRISSYLSLTEVGDEVILELLGDSVLTFVNVTIEGEPE